MPEANRNDWLEAVNNEFEHPAIALWRAVELRHIHNALKALPLKEPILDLGCAEGKIAGILFNGQKLIGLDNCWELLSQNHRPQTYKALILADACKMPYKERVFSSVFSNCVIEHIHDLKGVLSETERVLKEQGLLIFTVPSHKFADFLFFSIVFDKIGLKKLSRWYGRKRNQLLNHFHCYDHMQWRQILEESGFNLLSYDYYMSKEATFAWDFLAILVFISRYILPIKKLRAGINSLLGRYSVKYYHTDTDIGGGLLIIAKKYIKEK